MSKTYSFYCSGGASRLLKFYQRYSILDYPVSFVFYDGGQFDVIAELRKLFGNRLILDNDDQVEKLSNTSEKLLYVMTERTTDYLFCFGDKILKGELLIKYENRIINFHPSLLPAFPGLNAIDQALKTSVQILGNTAHFIDKGIDTGPIILQSVISRSSYREYEDVLELQIDMLRKVWDLINNDSLTVIGNRVEILGKANNNKFYSI